jgi:uncharacterized membrane protein
MRKLSVWAACFIVAGWAAPSRAGLADAARAVFAARCAGCHGPALAKPQGRFGYVLDLRKMAGSPEMVIPSHPEQSELWAVVQHGEMPPEGSPQGPLTAEEKETIRRWIAAGAPDVAEPTAPAPAESATRRMLRLLGKLHLLALHFPIALVIAAALVELWAACRGSTTPPEAARACLWLAAITALPTAAFGWLHAADGNGAASPGLLALHRWLGTAAGALIVLAALVYERDVWRGERGWQARVVLILAVLSTSVAAHFGGLLDRGARFFDW